MNALLVLGLGPASCHYSIGEDSPCSAVSGLLPSRQLHRTSHRCLRCAWGDDAAACREPATDGSHGANGAHSGARLRALRAGFGVDTVSVWSMLRPLVVRASYVGLCREALVIKTF